MKQVFYKGDFAYLKKQQKKTALTTLVYFSMALLVFFIGYITTKTRNNLLTVVAILGVLPASKSAVGMIMYLRVKPIGENVHDMARPFEQKMTILYHMLLSSEEKIIFAECVAIYEHSLFLLCKNMKVDEKKLCAYLKKILANQGKGNVTVKLYRDEAPFFERLKTILQVQKKETATETEKKLKEILCGVSL